MIDVHFWPTPNGLKITVFLEEAGLPYRVVPVDISKGAQHEPSFLEKSPNNRIPAIVDHAPAGGGAPISVFESGAILLYLAEKTGRFLPKDARARVEALEWLFWQVGGVGPMFGQYGHFAVFAKEKIPYAVDRYRAETERLLGVLERRLTGRSFLAGGELTIADMATAPWIVGASRFYKLDVTPWKEVTSWVARLEARPGFARGLAVKP